MRAVDGAPTALDTVGLLGLFDGMVKIRAFEEEVMRLFTRNLVRASTHLCQGQEAVSVGVCDALEAEDTMTCTYRGHGAVLAMGAPLDRALAEILGKAEGLCSGKGGSMHLTDTSVGAMGSFAIVGAHLPFACGAALAAQHRGVEAVSVCFFGDGATNIGAFHESLNLASIWKLPVVFVCENNLYGEYSPLASTTPIERLADRAASYAMRSETVDGNDVLAMREAALAARAHALAGSGPTLIEALTYRQVGHSRSDPALYRPEGELERWLENDPIRRFERALAEQHGVGQEEIDATRARAELAMVEASGRAMAWSEPAPEARFEHLWAAA